MASRKTTRLLLAPLIVLAVAGFALLQRQYIYDQIKLYGYEPSSDISQLATDTAMNDGARKVFYVNHPELIDRARFSSFCSKHNEQTAVLGCYKGPQRGIYLLAVTNNELNGIEEVTAAHEMLHAQYDRLSNGERKKVDKLLEDYFANGLKDEATRKTIDGYKNSEPDDLVNEMHSIIGTQVGSLPSELEEYYEQYFTDRSKVVKLYQSYEQAFSSRQAQIDQYDAQLTAQKKELDQLETSVTSGGTALQTQRAKLTRLESGDAATYNAQVDVYNASVASYNADVRRLRTLVDQYNALVEKRNAISFEEQKLVEAISAPSIQQQ